MAEIKSDITRNVLGVLFIVGLIGASIWILRPFLGAVVWAGTIVVATWPLMTGIQARLWGRRWLAVATMTILLLAVLVVPLAYIVGAIVSNVDEAVAWIKSLGTLKTAAPPDWLAGLPFVGPRIVELWQRATAAGVQELAARVLPYAGILVSWLAAQLGGFGVLLVQFLLTVVLAAAMYANGERAAARLVRFGRRLAGSGGETSVYLAGQTIRAVALGVVVTALAQTAVGGIGLLIAGVPFAALFSGIMFIFAVAQIGVIPVLAPAVIWLYWSGDSGWGTFLLVWTIITGAMDNFLRPILIRRGADLPLLLVFAGVIGGLFAFGLIGIFVGPVVLAVTDALLNAWIDAELKSGPAAEPPVTPG
jgi:predicted PurR-regulated permease PerM